MNGRIEIRTVNVRSTPVQKSCIEAKNGKWFTVKAIVNTLRGGLSAEEGVEEFNLDLADVLAAESYATTYPQIME